MMYARWKKSLLEKTALFAASESGMTLPLLALSLLALTGFTGIAIDVGRVQMVQSKLQFSVDSAGLAAGATVSTASAETEFRKYLDANFNGYMGSTVTGYSVTPSENNTVFTLSATATLPTTFMGTVGIRTITLTANSQISRAITGLELVFVLDNTGSMGESAGGSMTKIQALKNASKALTNTLFGGATTATNGKLWIGVVPFAHAVNIGTSHMDLIGNRDATLNAGWNGCVDARQHGFDVTDDPPAVSDSYTFFNLRSYTKSVTSSGHTTTTTVASCTPATSYYPSSTTTCAATGPYAFASPLESGDTYGQNPSCAQEITPMTNTKLTVTSAIDSMSASGNTVINQGLVWAWNMLSPRWRGLWSGTMNANNLPLDYNTQGMIKAVVLVTDGENTIDNSIQGSYWFARNKWTGTSNTSLATTYLDQKTLALCTAMKSKGIYVYTIGLGTSGGINTSLLSSCATAVNYYFLSPTTSQLDSVFNAIGNSLSNLRVSK